MRILKSLILCGALISTHLGMKAWQNRHEVPMNHSEIVIANDNDALVGFASVGIMGYALFSTEPKRRRSVVLTHVSTGDYVDISKIKAITVTENRLRIMLDDISYIERIYASNEEAEDMKYKIVCHNGMNI